MGIRHTEIDGLRWVRKNIYEANALQALLALHDVRAQDMEFVGSLYGKKRLMIAADIDGRNIFVELADTRYDAQRTEMSDRVHYQRCELK